MSSICILNGKKKGGCTACAPQCQHRVALVGLNGKGGRIGAANMPSEYSAVTLANSPARADQAKTYAKVDGYVTSFDRQFETDGDRIKSLFLWSESPGTGKTTTASAILTEWIAASYIGALRRGLKPVTAPAYFLDVNELQALYTGFTRPNMPQDIAEQNSRPYYQRMEKAKKAPFAVLDDIGVRTASEGFRGDLHKVINHRCANGMPTVYTSNLPMEEMAAVFDKRLYDRIRDQCQAIYFEGTSKRGRR